ncbi:MAG TPA: DMT family transporter [Gammaproteobacteria bacterium]|nr:DMT family transporter [Gammaproteobacteria bacterium]
MPGNERSAVGAGDASPVIGIALMLAAMAVVPLMDGVAKHLSATFPVLQVVWARYFFHLLILLPVVLWRHGASALLLRNPWLQLIRGGFLLGSTILFFAAIAVMPIADALALVFVAPLVVTALSPVFLGERVGLRRWTAVSVGFVGVLVIVRPGLNAFHPGMLLALGAGTVYAFYRLATRKLSGSAPPLVTLVYTALLGAVVMSAVAPAVWAPPGTRDLLWMVLMGALAAGGHFLVIKSFEHAEASLLAPLGYSEIVMATLVGYLAFGDFPDAWTWAGIAIVIASGVYVSTRERRVGGG